jgi:hypothetical protein
MGDTSYLVLYDIVATVVTIDIILEDEEDNECICSTNSAGRLPIAKLITCNFSSKIILSCSKNLDGGSVCLILFLMEC